jgi:virginiamycin B lyase
VRRLALIVSAFACAVAPAAHAAPTIKEFPLPTAGAQPQDIVQAPDGNMWFAERGLNKIGRISGSSPGAVTEFDVAAGGLAPDIIVVGPDNNLWYTELSSNSIGRMPPGNPAGVTRFTGLGLISPRGIAVGPDNNLWVSDADAAGPKVVRVSTAGAAVGSPIPLGMGVNPRGIARGADGNMWVADFSTPGGVVRVTPGGVATRFPVSVGSPIDVIAGSDGNIWYGGQGTAVGKVTPTGVATPYVAKGVDPFGVTLGPDGAVWFAEFQGNAVGRVDKAGVTSHVTGMTAGAGPRYVAFGPGNTIWFTEETGNRVGRVTGIELPGGGGGGGGGGGSDVVKPTLRSLHLTTRRFRLGSKGTSIRFRLSEVATLTLSFERVRAGRKVGKRCVAPTRRNRRHKSCRRYAALKSVLTLRRQAAGEHRISFRGRLAGKALAPALYRLTLRARDAAGNVSTRARATFTLLPRKPKRR